MMAATGSTGRRPDALGAQRVEARLAAFRLVEATQVHDVRQALTAALAEAEEHGWDEVARVLLYADVVRGFVDSDPSLGYRIERLRERAESDGDDVLLAVALASRSEYHYCSESSAQRQQSDHDLARATALLDADDGVALERATAYVACAVAYSVRELWELEEEMYAAGVALLADCELPLLDAVVLFNRAEAYVRIACGLREVDELDELTALLPAARAAVEAADREPVPLAWRIEARVYRHLLSALSACPSPESSVELTAATEREVTLRSAPVVGMVRLADGLRAADAGEWTAVSRHSEQAYSRFRDDEPTPVLALALRLAAQAEAKLGSIGACKALRYGEYSARRRWEARLRTLGSARASLQIEQLRVERDRCAREALSDELTGLTNRRGYVRHLKALAGSHVPRRVAVLLVDVDRFKAVNDTHGHSVGDWVLVHVARALTVAIRPADLVARVGGDEFVVVLDDVDGAAGHRRALDIQARLTRVVREELPAGLRVSISVGVAAGLSPGLELLVEQADSALYAAKARGGSSVTVADTVDPVRAAG